MQSLSVAILNFLQETARHSAVHQGLLVSAMLPGVCFFYRSISFPDFYPGPVRAGFLPSCEKLDNVLRKNARRCVVHQGRVASAMLLDSCFLLRLTKPGPGVLPKRSSVRLSILSSNGMPGPMGTPGSNTMRLSSAQARIESRNPQFRPLARHADAGGCCDPG